MPSLGDVVARYMSRVPGLGVFCERCLRSERWGGSVVLMVVDAAFTSIGLNYFTSVVPAVVEFSRRFVETGRITRLVELAGYDVGELRAVWRNRRSWSVAQGVASVLTGMDPDDRAALRRWAAAASLEDWRRDPVGGIRGVGLTTYQYLRMMGGVDTVMPDKIVKRVINGIRREAGLEPVEDDVEFVREAERMARLSGYRPIELCWMTWLIQREGRLVRMEKYADVLPKI